MLKEKLINYLENKNLNYSICIKNLMTNDLYCINHTQKVFSASIIKLYIMGAALEAVHKKKLSLTNRYKVSKTEQVRFSIVTLLNEENSYTLKDLIILMIIQSDNTATNKLIDIVGMDNINEFIKRMGFKNTLLQRKMMDAEARKNGKENYTSAEDTLLFFQLVYDGKLIDKEYSELMKYILTHQLDGSMMRIYLPDELTIAHKTGDLDFLKHDAGIVYTETTDYIFIMFTWNTESDCYARNAIGEVSRDVYESFVRPAKDDKNN